MPNLLISSCLLGNNCKYDGGNNRLPDSVLNALRERYTLVPTCPESSGGLPTPREPSERVGERVMSISGRDVTSEYMLGAKTAETLYRRYNCVAALMKAHSPSCGRDTIYDGTFSGTLTPRDGTVVERLRLLGATVYTEKEVKGLLTE